MRGSDGKLWFSKKGGGGVWKDCAECIVNNDYNHDGVVDAVEGPVGIADMDGVFAGVEKYQNCNGCWTFRRVLGVNCS